MVLRPLDKCAYILEDYSSYFSSKTNVVGTQKNRLNNIKLLLFLKDLFVDFDKQIISILQKKIEKLLDIPLHSV